MIITILGNFRVPYTTETHHALSLESLGHTVIRLQESEATAGQVLEWAVSSDLFVWIHTHGWETPEDSIHNMVTTLEVLRAYGIPTMTYHLDLWMGLARQKDIKSSAYWQLDHFFTVDQLMADYLNQNTPVRGHYLTPAVFHEEAYYTSLPASCTKDVIFVGSQRYHPEWPYRTRLLYRLSERYGDRFTTYGPDSPSGQVRGPALNQLYNSAKVVVGDTLCQGFDYPYYWSDRLPETLGRGGFMIHPYIRGLEAEYTIGCHLDTYHYNDFEELYKKIDYYLEHDDEREEMRLAGHNHVRNHHTYLRRWQTILDTVFAS